MRYRSVAIAGLFVAGLASTASNYPAQEPESSGIPWLVWVLVILALAAFVGFMIWWLRRQPTEQRIAEEHTPAVPARAAEPAPIVSPPATPDDLERIEGIGPRIASVLREAGIVSFSQLATTDVGRLQQILDAANLKLANPATWPEQARLAAAGDWAAFEALTGRLRGGRQV